MATESRSRTRPSSRCTLESGKAVTGTRLPQEARPRQTEAVLSGSAIGPESLATKNGCTTGDLVALDPDGNEVARHSAPLCVDDLWVIESPVSSSAP